MKKDNIKTVVIVVLTLVIVLGGSYFVSELQDGKNHTNVWDENKGTSSNNGGSSSDNDSNNPGSDTNNPTDPDSSDEQKEHKAINIDEYLSLKKGSDLAIIYIARPTCSYCVKQGPILKNVAYLYNLEVNYLNTDELSQDGFNKLAQSDEYFQGRWGTPTILLVKDDKVIAKANGYRSKDALVTFFKENGLIKG